MGPLGDSNTVTLQMDWLLKWCTMAYCCARRSEHLTRFIREASSCSQRQSTETHNRSMRKEWETVACSVPNGRSMPCPSLRGSGMYTNHGVYGSWELEVERDFKERVFSRCSRTVVHTNVTACTRLMHAPTRHNPTTSWRAVSFWEREGELPLVTRLQVGDPYSRQASLPR